MHVNTFKMGHTVHMRLFSLNMYLRTFMSYLDQKGFIVLICPILFILGWLNSFQFLAFIHSTARWLNV